MKLQKPNILLVENHIDALVYLKNYLEECGYHVIPVQNFQAALFAFSSRSSTSPIDIFICDILLPDGNGLELIKHARHDSPTIYSIAISGMDTHRNLSLAAGYNHYLLKPFSPDHLEPLLEEALNFQQKKRAVNLKKATQDPEKELLKRALFEVAEREQHRIERELHNSLCQHLLGAAFATKALSGRLAREGSPFSESAEDIARLINEAVIHVRSSCQGLHPIELKTTGLCKALASLINRAKRPITACSFHCDEKIKITNENMMLHFYRIAQECITDILEKGGASSVVLSFTQDDAFFYLKVTDDSPHEGNLRQDAQNHTMRLLKYRAEAIDGHFSVSSLAPQGTETLCKVSKHEAC